MKRVLFLFGCLVILSPSIYAEESPNISFGTVSLHLGMLEEEIFSSLKQRSMVANNFEDFSSQKGPIIHSYMIAHKSEPSDSLGQIIIENGKLSFISKFWAPPDQSAEGFLQTLYGGLATIIENNQSPAVIKTSTYNQPQYEVKHIDLYIGPYRINISCMLYYKDKLKNNVSIVQYLTDNTASR